jgi:hypothetical protein
VRKRRPRKVEPSPTIGGAHKPEPEFDRLSNILKVFNVLAATAKIARNPQARISQRHRKSRLNSRGIPLFFLLLVHCHEIGKVRDVAD